MPQHLQTMLVAIKRLDLPAALPEDAGLEYFGYTKTQVEKGAKLFLEVKGFINPLVVKRTNNIYNGVTVEAGTPRDRYEVISGFLEYFCAKRANEIRPSQESAQAIILNSSLTDNLIKQIELFRIGTESIQPDTYWGDDDLDFELVIDQPESLDALINRALKSNSVEDCFAAAERLCRRYPDPVDRANAIAELETLKEQASGSIADQDQLDKFFAGKLDKFFAE